MLKRYLGATIFILKLPMIVAFMSGSVLAFMVASKELLEASLSFVNRIMIPEGKNSDVISTLTLAAEHYLIAITLFVIAFSVERLVMPKGEGDVELLEFQMIGMVVVVMSADFLNLLLNGKATLPIGLSIAVVTVGLGCFIYLRERTKKSGEKGG